MGVGGDPECMSPSEFVILEGSSFTSLEIVIQRTYYSTLLVLVLITIKIDGSPQRSQLLLSSPIQFDWMSARCTWFLQILLCCQQKNVHQLDKIASLFLRLLESQGYSTHYVIWHRLTKVKDHRLDYPN
jgi:hypothetical protein